MKKYISYAVILGLGLTLGYVFFGGSTNDSENINSTDRENAHQEN